MQDRLQEFAALKGVSVRVYCEGVINRELSRDEAGGGTQGGLSLEVFERIQTRRKELYGGKPFTKDSAALLGEARAIREAEMEA